MRESERVRRERKDGMDHAGLFASCCCSALALVGSGASRWILVDSDWTDFHVARALVDLDGSTRLV